MKIKKCLLYLCVSKVACIGDNYKHQEMVRVLICVDIFKYQICWKAV